MSWVVSLVGCGGPAVSRCGHETRRHRVRGALFASVFASVLLAACGGGSGGNLTTSSEREPGPPETGPLTATGGDGQGSESENEQQQQKIIVNQEEEQEENNNEEQQQITVNVQPDPEESESEEQEEESESEEQEEESEEQEEQQQQLTIIEEEDFPYVPPEEEEPRYSAQTQTQTQGSRQGSGNSLARSGLPEPKPIDDCGSISPFQVGDCAPAAGHSSSISGTGYNADYTVNNNWYSPSFVNLEGKDRHLEANIIGRTSNAAFRPSDANYNFAYNMDARKDTEVTYTKGNGFHGFYSYEGASGQITEDVTLKATFFNIGSTGFSIEGYIGDNNGITMGGTNFGQIKFSTSKISEDGQFIIDNGSLHFSNLTIRPASGTFNILRGSFKNDGTRFSFPTQLVGELEMKRFFDTSAVGSNKPLEYNEKVFSRGDNALAGVFVADKTNEVAIRSLSFPLRVSSEGNIGMFSYGLWASENFLDNRIVFLEQTTKFNPERTTSDFTSHTYHTTASGNVEFRYKREDGFKGAYIYEGEIGTLTGDVDLYIGFNGHGATAATGSILTDLEIGGYDLKGIAMGNGGIDYNTGVGVIHIDADGRDDNNTAAKLAFGDFLVDLNAIDRPTVNNNGLARKLRMVLSPDGIQAQGSTPETYPSQIAGELEINGFKIKESDGDNNTILGGVCC